MKMLLLFFSLIVLNSCGSNPASEERLDGKYALVEVLDEDISEEGLTLTFDPAENRVSGTTTCNGFFATYAQEENKISLSQAGSTRKYCEGEMELETKILSTLPEISEFKIDEDQYILSSSEGEKLFVLKKK